MARNTYTLDGIPLTDPDGRWFLESTSGLRLIPAKRSPNISYPGVDGDAFISGSSFLPGGVVITMYVEGVDHEDFMTNVEYINALFLQRHKLLELRHDYDVDGAVSRHAFVKFNSGSEIKMVGTGVRAGTLNFMAEIPGAFWRSAIATQSGIEAYNTQLAPSIVRSLTGGNAPVDDALIRFKGGFSRIELEDITTGSKLIVNTPLTDREFIVVDTKNWTARKFSSDETVNIPWEGGTNVDMSVVSNRGYGSMFIMEPSLWGTDFMYRVTGYTSNPVGSPRIDILAKKSYL